MPPVQTATQETRPVPRKIIGGTVSAKALMSVLEPEAKSVGELTDKMSRDYQVKIADLTYQALIASAGTTIKVTGGDQRGKILEGAIQKLWANHLSEMLNFLKHGRAAFEEVWAYSEKFNLTYIRKLDYLPFKHTTMKIDAEGAFNGIELKTKGTYHIPRESSYWLALDPTALCPHGVSMFMGAAEDIWRERQNAIRLRILHTIKMILSGGIMYAPTDTALENGETLDIFAAIAAAHDARLSGGLMILPNTPSKMDPSKYEYDYIETPSINDPAPLDAHITELDQQQLLAFGIPPKALMDGSVGSEAMLSLQMEVLNAIADHYVTQAEKSFEKYVATKIIEANFAPGEVSVEVSHESLLSNANPALVEIVKTLLTGDTMPALIKEGIVDLGQLLRLAKVPLAPEAMLKLEKLLREMKAKKIEAERMAKLNPLGVPPQPIPGQQKTSTDPQASARAGMLPAKTPVAPQAS